MTNQETAVTVIEPGVWEPRTIEVLTPYPTSQYNVLVPTVSVRQVNPFLVPDVEVVQLNPDPTAGEIYHSEDMKQGEFAPTKVGLRKLRDVAGITVIDSRRIDHGNDPDYVEWRVEIEMTQPSGRTVRAMGTKGIDLRGERTKGWTPARLGKAREHMVANAESKAENRALRSILALRQAYPRAELAKPFAILRYVPDMSNPEVRARALDLLMPAMAQAFGPAAKQVGPGDVDQVPEAPDDDEPSAPLLPARASAPAQADADSGTPTAAAPGPSGAPEEPEWMRGGPAAAAPTLVDTIRASAADPGAQRGKPTQPQWEALERIFAEAGEGKGAVIKAGLAVLWPQDGEALSGARARAIILTADSLDGDFLPAWRELAGGAS